MQGQTDCEMQMKWKKKQDLLWILSGPGENMYSTLLLSG